MNSHTSPTTPAVQPREHDVLCTVCLRRKTWNVSAVCNTCLLASLPRGPLLEGTPKDSDRSNSGGAA